jgi:tetratricopeptide (TPR) repeat protein
VEADVKRRTVNVALALVGLVIIAEGTWSAWTLLASRGSLTLTTDPPGASVFVDGHFIGTAPLKAARVPLGSHVVRITKHDFLSVVREVKVSWRASDLAVALPRPPSASIEIASQPPGADVVVDGEPRGKTPVLVAGLSPGAHTVRLSLVNFSDWTRTVNADGKTRAALSATLESRTEGYYLDAVKVHPADAEKFVELAHYYVIRNEWKKAEDALYRAMALAADPKNPENYRYLYRIHDETDRIFLLDTKFTYGDQEAVRRGQEAVCNAFARAIREFPRFDFHYGYGVGYCRRRGLGDLAQEIVEAGILGHPNNLDWYTQAVARQPKQPDPPRDMLPEAEAAIRKDPKDFVGHFERMSAIRQRGAKDDDVIAELETLVPLAHSPAVRSRLLNEAGRLHERKGSFDKAIEAYSRAIEAEPGRKEKASLEYNLVRALNQNNRTDEALAAWEKAVGYLDDVEAACGWRLNWAEQCIKAGKKDKARVVLEDVLKLSKNQSTLNRAQELMNQAKS